MFDLEFIEVIRWNTNKLIEKPIDADSTMSNHEMIRMIRDKDRIKTTKSNSLSFLMNYEMIMYILEWIKYFDLEKYINLGPNTTLYKK